MATVMTNTEFVKKLKDVAQNYKTLYVMGCFGAPMNATNKARYTKNHSYNKQASRTAMINAASADTFGFDCVCLLKGILWGWNGDKNKTYGGAGYAVNGVPDIGADSMIKVCSGVSTDFSNIVPGEAVWMEGHIGAYIGDGLAVECTPAWANKVQITAVGNIGKKSGYNTRTWTKHGKLPYVKYETGAAPATPVVTPTKPTTNNTTFKVGDLVKITGTKYYSGAKIPDWVIAKNWYVSDVSGARVVINKSEDGKNAICSPVNAADLALATVAPTPATPTTPTPAAKTIVAKGIDVSKWQGEIDWAKVKAAGINFAMIRLGYGSANGNECGVDGYFEKNVTNAIKAGVDIGCYFYSYATSVAAAKKEAEFVVGVLNQHKGVFTYPVAFDLEDSSQAGIGKVVLTDMVLAFKDVIEKAGFYASLYSNLNWLKNYLDDSKLTGIDHWLAQWASAPTYTGSFGMWQSSSTGKVNGINGNVDTDFAYKDYPTEIKTKKLNGFTSTTQAPVTPTTPVVEPTKPATGLKFKVGDIVNFTGKTHYTSANATSGVATKASKAKVTDVYATGKHPYHCRAVNDSGAFIGGVYGWVDAADVSAIEAAKPATPAPAPVTPAKPATATIKVGDVVKITGTKYYSGAKIPDWVRAKNWIVKEVSGARVVIDKSQDGKNAICSPVNAADVAVATASVVKTATPVVNTIIEAGDTVKIVGTKYYSGAKIPNWVRAKNWIVLEAKGDRVVVNKSADGKNAICSPIKRSDLQLVKKK